MRIQKIPYKTSYTVYIHFDNLKREPCGQRFINQNIFDILSTKKYKIVKCLYLNRRPFKYINMLNLAIELCLVDLMYIEYRFNLLNHSYIYSGYGKSVYVEMYIFIFICGMLFTGIIIFMWILMRKRHNNRVSLDNKFVLITGM